MNSNNSKSTGAETIIYHTRCHWALFLGPLIVIIIGGLAIRAQGMHALALMVFGLIWVVGPIRTGFSNVPELNLVVRSARLCCRTRNHACATRRIDKKYDLTNHCRML